VKLIGYIRVSRVAGRGGDSFISPEVQRTSIAGWARARAHEIVDWHTDLDQSGGKLERPEFQRAIARCERGEADGIAVAKLDRFARSLPDAVASIRRLEDAGCELVSVADNLDASPTGRFARSMLFAIAELERERITESWQAAVEHAVARGVYIARTAPAGYTREPGGGLVVDEAAADAVREAFRARKAGRSWTEVGRSLATAGVYPQGSRYWSVNAVRYLIRNRAYLGEVWRGGRCLNPAAHEPIIGRALYEAANATRRSVRTASAAYLLSGLVRCAGCRHTMPGNARLLREQTGGKQRTYRYHCQIRHHAGECPAPASIAGHLLEPLVVDAFLARHRGAAAIASQADGYIAELERALADAEAELEAFRDDLDYARALGRDSHLAGVETRARVVEARRVELAASAAQRPPVDLVRLDDYWASASTSERRELLSADIAAVFVRRAGGKGAHADASSRMHIVWNGDSIDLPRRGCKANDLPPFTFPKGES